MADLQGARRRRLGVVAQGDGLSHEDGIDLVEPPVQAHGAVLHDAAFGLEEEQVVEVEVGAVLVAVEMRGYLANSPRELTVPVEANQR